MSVKISADKGMTGFLFGHYNDLMGSEVTHSNVFSEDSVCSGRRIRNNRVENFFFFLFTLCTLDLISLRGKVTPLAQILVLIKDKHEIIAWAMCCDSAAAWCILVCRCKYTVHSLPVDKCQVKVTQV